LWLKRAVSFFVLQFYSLLRPMLGTAMQLKVGLIMVLSGLAAICILLASYTFAFTSLPFMGDEIESRPVVLIIASLALIVLIDIFSVWRFKKLNANFAATGGWKALLWIYQGLYVILIAGANVLIGAVGVFYFVRLLSEPLV